MIFFGRKSLEKAVREYVEHYHAEHYHAGRNHQGLGNQLIEPGNEVGPVAGKIECYERLGGILKYYHRRAAGTAERDRNVTLRLMKVRPCLGTIPFSDLSTAFD